jgi:hypothetical protein
MIRIYRTYGSLSMGNAIGCGIVASRQKWPFSRHTWDSMTRRVALMFSIYTKKRACMDEESCVRDDGRCAKRRIIAGAFNDLSGVLSARK